jgi:hypothetical protein
MPGLRPCVGRCEAWVKIGRALQIGRDYSLKTTGANRPAGQIYSKAFSAWIAKHGFNGIEKTVRSAALDLVEHLAEIEAWRLTLSEKRRRQLKHPLSNVAAWRKATTQAKSTNSRRGLSAARRSDIDAVAHRVAPSLSPPRLRRGGCRRENRCGARVEDRHCARPCRSAPRWRSARQATGSSGVPHFFAKQPQRKKPSGTSLRGSRDGRAGSAIRTGSRSGFL